MPCMAFDVNFWRKYKNWGHRRKRRWVRNFMNINTLSGFSLLTLPNFNLFSFVYFDFHVQIRWAVIYLGLHAQIRLAVYAVLVADEENGFAVLVALVCSSFVRTNQGTSMRDPLFPEGREDLPSVYESNMMLARLLHFS